MFCSNCGTQLAESATFCVKCGAQRNASVQTPAPPPPAQPRPAAQRKKNTAVTWVVVLGVIVAVWLIFSFGGTTPTTSSNTSSPASGTPAAAQVSYKINDSVTVGYWSYRVYGTQWKNSIGSEYMSQTPDAVFLVIDLAIRNNDKTSSTLPPLKLVDSEGREYDESAKAWSLANSFGALKSLNPGVVSRGYAVFDVPKGQYKLKAPGGFTSGEHVFIELHK